MPTEWLLPPFRHVLRVVNYGQDNIVLTIRGRRGGTHYVTSLTAEQADEIATALRQAASAQEYTPGQYREARGVLALTAAQKQRLRDPSWDIEDSDGYPWRPEDK